MDAEQVDNISRAGTPQPPKPVQKETGGAPSKQVVETKAEAPSSTGDTVSLSNEAKQALESVKTTSANSPTSQQRNFDVTENNQVILKIKDQETQQVVKQIPAEEEVRLRQAIQEGVESLDKNV